GGCEVDKALPGVVHLLLVGRRRNAAGHHKGHVGQIETEKIEMIELRRLAWNGATCALREPKHLAVLFLVAAAIFAWAAPRICAASNAAEAVCDVNADYALGVEDYPEAIRLHEKVLRRQPNNALAHYHLG